MAKSKPGTTIPARQDLAAWISGQLGGTSFALSAAIDLARVWPAGLVAAGYGSIIAAIVTNRETSMPTYDYGCERCGLFTNPVQSRSSRCRCPARTAATRPPGL